MARKRSGPPYPPPPQQHEIELEFEGKGYRGYYTTEKGTLTVNLGGGRKQTWIDSHSHVESLARIMLGELVGELLQKKNS